ncbi:type II secretion system protein GspH [Pseudoalteromonas luteoviolacea]|uniref:Type II secretion system protein H n=1 Tax=Pseudoalteromonas luteoviolacea TaxID=43657 RepID=A0A1C0TLC9_9GAMM|nr:GspH/FimT family pseudopilin [Pseudoalteromonas luteoviolacea]MBQ4813731.1 GspH/FimT family pseudopilin [Pseudoalteromonas luteoviolacea]OCQ19663.1 type II secretion system protein GspH [Pseudoalteromonas luteoviolacea]
MNVGKSKEQGVTLIELLICVALVAVLASLAMPSVITYIKQDRVDSNVHQLSSVYQYARSEAVKREQTVKLVKENSNWLVKTVVSGQETTLRTFTIEHQSIHVDLVDREVRSTGELNLMSNILVSDNDSSTRDYRLCILRSGQSWVSEAAENCA